MGAASGPSPALPWNSPPALHHRPGGSRPSHCGRAPGDGHVPSLWSQPRCSSAPRAPSRVLSVPLPRSPGPRLPAAPGGLAAAAAPSVPGAVPAHWRGTAQFYRTGANGTEDGTIWFSLALPRSAREQWAAGVFFLVGSFFLCVVFLPGQGRCSPSPWTPAASPPPGGQAAPCFSRGFFRLWVCILVALSDFCFIISSNRLWCQKH